MEKLDQTSIKDDEAMELGRHLLTLRDGLRKLDELQPHEAKVDLTFPDFYHEEHGFELKRADDSHWIVEYFPPPEKFRLEW